MTVVTWSSQLKVPPLEKPTADVLMLEFGEKYYYHMRLLLIGGELLAERCRTDDLMPSISLLFLPPCRVDSEIL